MTKEKEIARDVVEAIRYHNARQLSLNNLLAEIEIAVIKELIPDHATKTELAAALKINRTTLLQKMLRYRIAF